MGLWSDGYSLRNAVHYCTELFWYRLKWAELPSGSWEVPVWADGKAIKQLLRSVIIRWENEPRDWWYHSPLISLHCTDRTTAAEQTIFLLCFLSVRTRCASSSTTGNNKYQNLWEQMCLTAGADVSRGGPSPLHCVHIIVRAQRCIFRFHHYDSPIKWSPWLPVCGRQWLFHLAGDAV